MIDIIIAFIGFVGIFSYIFLIYTFSFEKKTGINAIKVNGLIILSISLIGFIFFSIIEISTLISDNIENLTFEYKKIMIFLTIIIFTITSVLVYLQIHRVKIDSGKQREINTM